MLLLAMEDIQEIENEEPNSLDGVSTRMAIVTSASSWDDFTVSPVRPWASVRYLSDFVYQVNGTEESHEVEGSGPRS